MLQFIDGFDLYSQVTDMPKTWSTTANLKLIPHNNNALEMTSSNVGWSFSMLTLQNTFSQGTMGLTYNPKSLDNSLEVLFFNKNKEQYRVSLEKNGALSTAFLGRELLRTGNNNYPNDWFYLNICQSDKMTITINNNTIFNLKKLPEVSFDRIMFSIPEKQHTPVILDDLFFDDEAILYENCIVASLPLTAIPSKIYGIKKYNQPIKELNDKNETWSYWQTSSFPYGTIALVSENSAPVEPPSNQSQITT